MKTVEITSETIPGFFRESYPCVIIGMLPRDSSEVRKNKWYADTEQVIRVIKVGGDVPKVDIRWCRLKKDDSWGTTPSGTRLTEEAFEALCGMTSEIRAAFRKLEEGAET